MKIETIHSFLVHPDKGEKSQSQIGGTRVSVGGDSKLVTMLTQIFMDAPQECRHDIRFLPNEKGEQQNDCRDLFLAYLHGPTKPHGLKIAQRLQKVTTHRSKLGLLFLMVGQSESSKRIVVSRFPADHGILADAKDAELDVKFVEEVFMKSETAYKSAVYEGATDDKFWKGKAIDKQINKELTVANYWIREFLNSDFAVTGAAGTRRFALNLRAAISATESVKLKQELSSLANLIPNLEGKVKSPAQMLADFSVSQEAVELVKEQFPSDKLFHENFKFLASEFAEHIAYRSIELDNGGTLTAEADKFDEVFKRYQAQGNRVGFSTEGAIVDDKLRKSK